MGHHGCPFKSGISGTHNVSAQTQHVAKEVGIDFVLTTTSHQSYQIYSQSKLLFVAFGATMYQL
jgi:hypothetical protein